MELQDQVLQYQHEADLFSYFGPIHACGCYSMTNITAILSEIYKVYSGPRSY